MAAQSFGAVAGDPRVGPLLQGVHRQYVGDQDFANNNGQEGIFTPEHLDQVSTPHHTTPHYTAPCCTAPHHVIPPHTTHTPLTAFHTQPQIADQSMPLCMRGLHKGVKQDHKLRHQGRQQYWLYLKGAGLSMEDSIRFFQVSLGGTRHPHHPHHPTTPHYTPPTPPHSTPSLTSSLLPDPHLPG